MILDNYIAKYLLNKNISVRKTKICLNIIYTVVNVFLYFTIFNKINKSKINFIIFLVIAIYFQLYRVKQLDLFIKKLAINEK